ncbi:MAG: serine/threonine protein kinase, partial [Frankia sp.]|nr:serine/threonine protein kinase [Frankia sp.]
WAEAAAPGRGGAGAGTAGAAGQLTAKGSRPAPPAELTAAEEDGAVALRWAPSPTPDVLYRVTRKVADQSAPGGWRLRVVGTTPVTELFDAGVPKGVPVSYEVVAMFREAALSGAAAGAGGPAGRPGAAPELPSPSRPVTTPPRVWLPTVAALRADLVQDAIALSWRPIPGHDEVIIERTFDRTSSVQGAMRRFRGGGGQFIDNDVQPGATYRYRVWVAPKEPGGLLDPRSGAEVVVTAVPRPRPVMDLESRPTLGGVLLRWKSVPGVLVRIYATPAATGTGLSGTGPFGPAGHEVHTGSLEGRARLVGESRRGSLVDKEATSDIVYTPVSVAGDRAVIGAAVHLR